MKYIILSFDDGKKDNYAHAYQIMLKYGVKASLHISTKYVADNNPDFMSLEEIREMHAAGFDFSSHGHEHINEKNDLAQSIACLKEWGLIDEENIVFCSPGCEIYEKNIAQYKEMLDSNGVKHVRTGVQISRNGFFYIAFYLVQKVLKSKRMFYLRNKSNLHNINDPKYFIKSVTIKFDNSIQQLEYFINKMRDGDVAVFMLHSVIPEKEIKNRDTWSFSAEKFEQFLQLITSKNDYQVITIKDYIKQLQ